MKNEKNKGIGMILAVIIVGVLILFSGATFILVKKNFFSEKISYQTIPQLKKEAKENKTEKPTENKAGKEQGEQKEQKKESQKQKPFEENYQEEKKNESEKLENKLKEIFFPKEQPKEKDQEQDIEQNKQKEKSEPQESQYQRQNLSFFKGIWTQPGGEVKALQQETGKMIADGINIFAMSVAYEINPDNTLKLMPLSFEWENNPEAGYLYLIRKAHEAGLAIYLSPELIYFDGVIPVQKRKVVMEKFSEACLYWAEIAEREKVELFSPINEPTQVFGIKDGIKWSEEILPLVREKFKGEIAVKLYGPEVGDFSQYGSIEGYDYVSIHIYAIDVSESEFFDYLEETVLPFLEQCVEKYNLKGYLFGEMGAEAKNNEWQARIFERFLEQTWQKTKGYFLCGWGPKIDFSDPFPDVGFTGRSAENTIKKWYTKI